MRLSDEALEIPGNCQKTKTLFDNQEVFAKTLEAVSRAPEAVANVPRTAVQFICPLARKSSIRISHSKKVQQ